MGGVRRSAEEETPVAGSSTLEITPLGAGNEVGRSCIIASFRGKKIMLDCGIHPGFQGMMSLPFFDEVDLSSVDVMLVTHFHLDHCAAVPYVTEKTDFKGRVLMTHPTKAIYHTLLMDFVRLTKSSSEEALYTEEDVKNSMQRIDVVDFHQTVNIDGVKVTPFAAGHVLGAAMFFVEIAGLKLLYTGDYSRTPDRHLAGAETPNVSPHVVIVESTYGVSSHRPIEERETRFIQAVRDIVEGGGRCLLPVVALGRAQELLLMLDEHWEQNPEIRSIPIYQASGLAQRALTVYQTYIEFMNESIRAAFHIANPFVLRHVQHLKGNLDDSGPCVVLATPSMLQSGLSRELFDSWCENPKNGCIIADFAVQGTLAREILSEPTEVTTRQGLKVPLRCKVEAISFSAHADFPQTRDFLDTTSPPHVVLVHGEMTEMGRLKRALEQKAATDGKQRQVHMPKNCVTVSIELAVEKRAKIVGCLAEHQPRDGQHLRGIIVRKGFTDTILDPVDMGMLTHLKTNRILQRQAIPVTRPLGALRLDLEALVFAVREEDAKPELEVKSDSEKPNSSIIIGNRLRIAHSEGGGSGKESMLVMEWESSPANDLLADAVVAVILQGEPEPPDLSKAESKREVARKNGDSETVRKMELCIVKELMRTQFGNSEMDEGTGLLTVDVDGTIVQVIWEDNDVICDDETLRSRVAAVLRRARAALDPVQVDL